MPAAELNHANFGCAAGKRLNTQNSTGQVRSTAAPKSKAAAALPVHLALAPPTTGPNIMVT
jgi:hypothetical protein